MGQESWGRRVWRLIYPGLTYFGICFIVEAIAAVFIAIDTAKALVASLENREEGLTLIDIATVKNRTGE